MIKVNSIYLYPFRVLLVLNFHISYVEAIEFAPSFGESIFIVPVLLVASIKFNTRVQALLGIKILRLCKQLDHKIQILKE